MCPGCRAILDADAAKCPYCGWEIARTRVRREGGLVERACAPLGGLAAAIGLANALLFVLTTVANTRVLPGLLEERGIEVPDPGALLVTSILGPSSITVLLLGGFEPGHVLLGGQAWRALSAPFLHFGILHIACNLSALLWLAPLAVEAWGAARALTIYLLGGIAACAAGLGWHLLAPILGIEYAAGVGAGASGAICALAGALGAIGLRVGGRRGRAMWLEMVKPVGLILLLGVVLEFTGGPFRLGTAEHAGGLLFGTLAGLVVSFGVRARGDPAAVRAWDFAAVALSLATVASLVPGFVALSRAA